MSNVQELIKWLLECDDIEGDGATGFTLCIPRREIMPKEFLQFAFLDLQDKSKKGKIGALANLKRAIDCQLDIFYEILKLEKIFCAKNLSFAHKTSLLSDIGMIQNKSINELNKIRNRMEHDYILPTEEDLEIYYDLTWNIIEIISLNMQIMSMNEVMMKVYNAGKEFCFSAMYDLDKSAIVFERFECGTQDRDVIEVVLKKKEDYQEFVRAFRVYRGILYFQSSLDCEHFMRTLETI